MELTDAQVEKQYRMINGLDAVDVGSVALLRKEVNKKLIAHGYKKLKGYISKSQLIAINRKYLS